MQTSLVAERSPIRGAERVRVTNGVGLAPLVSKHHHRKRSNPSNAAMAKKGVCWTLDNIPLGLCDRGEEGCDDVKSDLAWRKRDSRSAICFSRSAVPALVSIDREPFLSLDVEEQPLTVMVRVEDVRKK